MVSFSFLPYLVVRGIQEVSLVRCHRSPQSISKSVGVSFGRKLKGSVGVSFGRKLKGYIAMYAQSFELITLESAINSRQSLPEAL